MTIISVFPNSRALRACVRPLSDSVSVLSLLLFTVTNFTFANTQRSTVAGSLGAWDRGEPRVSVCLAVSACRSLVSVCCVPLFSSPLCCARSRGGLANHCVLRCGSRLSFDCWTRKKRMCHIMINGQSEFSIHTKGEGGGGYEPSDETNLFPLGRA